MNELYGFVPAFPRSVGSVRQLSLQELRAEAPFFWRSFRSALAPRFLDEHRLFAVRRLDLPFLEDAVLWRLDFLPLDNPAGPPALLVHLAFEVAGCFVPVDFTDDCLVTAMATSRSLIDLSTPELLAAYLAVAFAVSRRVRDHQVLISDFDVLTRPPEVSPERWTAAGDDAKSWSEEADDPAFLYLDQRQGQVVAFTVGYRHGSVFGMRLTVTPAERERRVVLEDPGLVSAAQVPAPEWGLRAEPAWEITASARREDRQKLAGEAIQRYRRWRPRISSADVDEVTGRARQCHEERSRRFSWLQVYPMQPAESPGDPETAFPMTEARVEAGEFFAEVRKRCADYRLPAFEAGRAKEADGDPGLTVTCKRLPFYPAHRLYRIDDRRGGRPRRTELLFAPSTEEPPDGLDRLIPRNDVSFTQHMLNEAYDLDLSGLEAMEYLDYFCDALSGEDGVFHVVETVDDVRWRGQAHDQRSLVEGVATPIRLWPERDGDSLVLDALLTYAGNLFHAEFRLLPAGGVAMSDDFPILERFDIAPEVMSHKTHFFLRPPAEWKAPENWLRRSLGS